MGGSSKSSSSSSQDTTTRDERIAASDNAIVLKDALQNLQNVTMVDGGAFDFGEAAFDFGKAVALTAVDALSDNFQSTLDKSLEFAAKAQEKTTSDTTGAQKLLPWLMAGVGVVAISSALKKG